MWLFVLINILVCYLPCPLSATLEAAPLAVSTPLDAMSFADSTAPYETEFNFTNHVTKIN